MTDYEFSRDGDSPTEMQAIIDGLYGDLYNLYMLATEPGQTLVHPTEGTIDRDEIPDTQCASEEAVEEMLGVEIAMQHIDNADQALDELSDMDF